MGKCVLMFSVILSLVASAHSQDLDPRDVRITLDRALAVAMEKAKTDFPELGSYLLYSVHPRVLKGDKKGLFWEVLWVEKAFPHYKQLRIRVYMSDASTESFRTKKVIFQTKSRHGPAELWHVRSYGP